MSNEFAKLHPLIIAGYYLAVICITIFQMHAVIAAISLCCGIIYFLTIKGRDGIKQTVWLVPVFLVAAAINPLFSHRGNTLLFYLPTGNPVTMESIIYGLVSGLGISGALAWCYSLNLVLTGDKVMAVLGIKFPKIALLVSMVLRFVPEFSARFREIYGVNKVNSQSEKKLRMALLSCSMTMTWALENSVDTADSMISRGYGTGKRTNYTDYRIEGRDAAAGIWMLAMFFVTVVSMVSGRTYAYYYPEITIGGDWPAYAAFLLLAITPVLFNAGEEIRWKRSR